MNLMLYNILFLLKKYLVVSRVSKSFLCLPACLSLCQRPRFLQSLLKICLAQSNNLYIPGRVAQLVTSLATDASLIADPEVASSIPARSHTFVEIDYEIISTIILLPFAESFKKDCCQLQVCAQRTG